MPTSVERTTTLPDGTAIHVRYDRLVTVVTTEGTVLTFDNEVAAEDWALHRVGHPVWRGWFPAHPAA